MMLPPIAIYCSSGSWGGLELNTVRLAQWLSERDHSITLFCLQDSPLATFASSLNIPSRLIARHKRYFDVSKALLVKRSLDQLNIRILLLVDNHDLDFGVLVNLLCRKRIRLIYQQHMRIGISKKDPIHTFRFRQLDAWITLLPYMKEEILANTRFPEERIHLIPLGIDATSLRASLPDKQAARNYLNLPASQMIMGILGRLDRQKGQHLVIEALRRLKQKGVSILLLIMGESTRDEGEDYLNELHQMVSSSGLQDDVFFRGYEQNVSWFYAAVDLFILGSFEETYGMVTIEAMVCGVPVIGSRAGGTPELLGNGKYGWLYQTKDPVDLANTINRALEDPQRLKQVSERAQHYAYSAFPHTKECISIETLIQSLD
ncbi:MAG: glycosyltransferase family 4 protein [Bacteroidales bacterium]|nr:glycosyltransferase family 4 protein [Bacteroidales bacterium]